MKDTDDDMLVDGSDAGANPAISTKNTLVGSNVHGQIERVPEWYYTPNEWSRSIGWGEVPDERNTLFKVELDRLEKNIKNYPENLKPQTIQWGRILELRRKLGMTSIDGRNEKISEESDT